MKKIVSIALVLVMAFTLIALTACGGGETTTENPNTTTTTRFGLGVIYSEGTATDFEAADPEDEGSKDTKGAASATYTACVLTIDQDGKITAAKFDAFEGKVEYDGTGAATVSNLTSKYALGEDYGMKAYAGSALEWFEQADAFASKLIGKTESEIAGLMAADYKGSADVVAAGCTIYVSDFVAAAQAAYAVAKTATAIEGEGVAVTVTSTKEITNATADANGTAVITTVIEGTCGTNKTTATYTATAGFTATGAAAGEKITVTKN